jgi:hypothetical protein
VCVRVRVSVCERYHMYMYINMHIFICPFGIVLYGNRIQKFDLIRDFECTGVRTSAIVPFCADLGPRDSVPSYSARIPKKWCLKF